MNPFFFTIKSLFKNKNFNKLIEIFFCKNYRYFLENNMFNFFLQILDQKCGNYVCVQLLQTLNIIFENIKNKTAFCKFLYYLF